MNIFVLDKDPRLAAHMHCDKHVSKMILETAQMLSTAHHVYNTPQASSVYKKAYLNHPCTKWVRESIANYNWAWSLYHELLVVFKQRRGKHHKSGGLIHHLAHTPPLPNIGLTAFAQAMPDQYKNADAVQAYRTYYLNDKHSFASWDWPTAKTPYWWFQIEGKEIPVFSKVL